MVIIIWLIATILGAFLYRLGGTSAGTKWRDLGVPTIATGYLLTLGLKAQIWGFWGLVGAYVAHFGLLFGALTSYFKPKGQPARWYNWLLTGFLYGLSALPLAIVTGCWIGFVIRIVTVTTFVTLWNEFIDEVNIEEGGRGAVIIATLPLLVL